jgi:pimeloyl-ACP methyl ester carboxylesterase
MDARPGRSQNGLHFLQWGDGGRGVLGIHGITASAVSLTPVARHLRPDDRFIAPDLRGRGHSADLPGPYGLQRHADDCAELIIEQFSGPVVVIGESMGAYVAVLLAERHPELVERLVLVDGGLPPHLPQLAAGDDPVAAVLGPVLARLRTTYPTRDAYRTQWQQHPSLAGHWNDDLDRYLDYEMQPVEGGYRSRTSEDAIRADMSDTTGGVAAIEAALAKLSCSITLLRAERNLVNGLPPILPDEVVNQWREVLPQLLDHVVADSNHYTIFFDDDKAALIAHAIDSNAV